VISLSCVCCFGVAVHFAKQRAEHGSGETHGPARRTRLGWQHATTSVSIIIAWKVLMCELTLKASVDRSIHPCVQGHSVVLVVVNGDDSRYKYKMSTVSTQTTRQCYLNLLFSFGLLLALLAALRPIPHQSLTRTPQPIPHPFRERFGLGSDQRHRIAETSSVWKRPRLFDDRSVVIRRT
jgi:hypothetical protein